MLYSQSTKDVSVVARPMYSRKDSAPKKNLYVWTYEITISNNTSKPVQLLNRYWKIIDSDHRAQEVRGPGVVGQRPIIQPNQSFSYTSFTHLPTSSGKMLGHFRMITDNGEAFDAHIPTFTLQLPVRLVHSQPERSVLKNNSGPEASI